MEKYTRLLYEEFLTWSETETDSGYITQRFNFVACSFGIILFETLASTSLFIVNWVVVLAPFVLC